MKVIIKSQSDQLAVDVDLVDTVGDLKNKIQDSISFYCGDTRLSESFAHHNVPDRACVTFRLSSDLVSVFIHNISTEQGLLIKVHPDATLNELQAKVKVAAGLQDAPHLTFKGRRLNNVMGRTLRRCGIQDNSVLRLATNDVAQMDHTNEESTSGTMTVFIEKLGEKPVRADVFCGSASSCLREHVNKGLAFYVNSERLYMTATIGSVARRYGLKEGSVINLGHADMTVKVLDQVLNRSIAFRIEPGGTVHRLMDIIEVKLGMPYVDQKLTFNLLDVEPLVNATLDDYGIKDGSTVMLWNKNLPRPIPATTPAGQQTQRQGVKRPHPAPVMQIFVKTAGNTMTINGLTPDSLVGDLKDELLAKDGIPEAHYYLVYGGKVLTDNSKTLEDYNVQKESTVFRHFRCAHRVDPDRQCSVYGHYQHLAPEG